MQSLLWKGHTPCTTTGEEDPLYSREAYSDSSFHKQYCLPLYKIQLLLQSHKVSKQRENAKHLGGKNISNWNPSTWKRFLLCIASAVCSDNFHLKDKICEKAVILVPSIFFQHLKGTMHFSQRHPCSLQSTGTIFWLLKIVYQSRVRVLKQLFLEYSPH